jgi:predicted DNA-binding protein
MFLEEKIKEIEDWFLIENLQEKLISGKSFIDERSYFGKQYHFFSSSSNIIK